jgi:hypothetical protein
MFYNLVVGFPTNIKFSIPNPPVPARASTFQLKAPAFKKRASQRHSILAFHLVYAQGERESAHAFDCLEW